MNRSPLGPLPHEMCGNMGAPKLGPPAFGVSATKSSPVHPVPSSPQMWRRLSQCPISWVAVRPRLYGAAAVPVLPVAVGTALAGGPPHRSQRAGLPHWAPASGSGVEAHLGVGVQDAGRWEPTLSKAVRALPGQVVALAAAP